MIPQRWQPFFQLLAARVRQFIREPHAFFWVYGFPLLLALGLGFAFRGTEPEPPDVDVQATPDKAKADELAARLRSANLKVEVLPEDECKKRLSRGMTSLYLIGHPDAIEYVYDSANKESVQARYWVEAVLLRNENSVKFIHSVPKEPGGLYVHFLLPGLIGTNIMGGGLFGLGFFLVDMRVRKLFKRLIATPMRHSDFLLAMVTSRLLFLIPEMTSLLVVGCFVFGLPIYGSIFTLILVIVVGAAAFAGMGLLVASRTEKTETATGLIQLVMLPQYVLSGVFFTSKRFPDAVQPFIEALPLTQLINAMREVMLEGKTLWEVSWRIGILAAYAAVTFTLALRWFKWR